LIRPSLISWTRLEVLLDCTLLRYSHYVCRGKPFYLLSQIVQLSNSHNVPWTQDDKMSIIMSLGRVKYKQHWQSILPCIYYIWQHWKETVFVRYTVKKSPSTNMANNMLRQQRECDELNNSDEIICQYYSWEIKSLQLTIQFIS